MAALPPTTARPRATPATRLPRRRRRWREARGPARARRRGLLPSPLWGGGGGGGRGHGGGGGGGGGVAGMGWACTRHWRLVAASEHSLLASCSDLAPPTPTPPH